MGGKLKKLHKKIHPGKGGKLPMSPGMKAISGKGGRKPAQPGGPMTPGFTPSGPTTTLLGQPPGMAPPVQAAGGLPPGVDPNAVAANPQGYEQWKQGAAQQAAMGQADPNAVSNSQQSYAGMADQANQQFGTLGGAGGDLGAAGGLSGSYQGTPQSPESLGLVGGGNAPPANPGLQGPQLSAMAQQQQGMANQASALASANALRRRQTAQPMMDYQAQGQGA